MRVPACLLVCACLALAADHVGFVGCAGEPVAGAVVVAERGESRIATTTDEFGRYVFAGLTPGTWNVSIRLFGFLPASQAVEVRERAEPLEWRITVESPLDEKREQPVLKTKPAQAQVPDETGPEDLAGFAVAEAAESVLVSGSLSRGLELARRDDDLSKMRADWVKDADKGPPLPGAPKPDKQVAGVGGRFEAPGEFAGFGGPAPGGPAVPKPKPPKPEKKGAKNDPPSVTAFGNRLNRWRDKAHGSLFASTGNSALDARPYSANGQAVAKAPYWSARAGFALGGPLYVPKIIDTSRTFFYLSYATSQSRNPFHGVGTVPDASGRTGDFGGARTPAQNLIFDPLSAQPFPQNRIPMSRIDRGSRGLLDYIPAPNQPGSVRNYQVLFPVPQASHDVSARINDSVSRADHVDASVAVQTRDSHAAQLYGFRDRAGGLGLSAGLSWLHSLGGKSVNNLRLTFSRNRNQTTPFFAFGRDVAGELGIQGTSRNPANFGPPNLKFTNYATLADASAQLRRDQTLSVNNSLKWHQETHKVDAGVEIRRTHIDTITDQDARGTFTFSGLATSGMDRAGQPLDRTGLDFADFLLGYPQSASIRYGSSDNYFRGWVSSVWLQDDWKPLAGFSMKYGLRYEYFAPPREKYGRMANLDVAPAFTAVAPVVAGGIGPFTGRFPNALVEPDRNNLSPRIGLAWRPFDGSKFHVRAGYGVFFDGSIYQRFPAQLGGQPPFARTNVVNTSTGQPLMVETAFTQTTAKQITNTFGVARSYQAGSAQTWNFSIKHDLPHHVGFEAGYLGTKGTRLNIQRMPNRAAPGSPFTAEDRRLIGNAVGFTWDSSEGNSIFHAAQFKFIRHFHKGVAAELLYTFSKSIDNASSFGGGGGTVAQDDRNLRAERALSSFDQRHRLGISYLWNSPFGDRGSLLRGGGWTSSLLGNWTLGGTVFLVSGTPFTARVLGNRADSGGTGAIGAGRADSTGLAVRNTSGFFNLLAFTLPPPGRFGNAARDTIPGPSSIVGNVAIARSFRLRDDRRRLELRAECANCTNHVNINALGTVVNSSEYGLALGAQPMRTIVLHLRVGF